MFPPAQGCAAITSANPSAIPPSDWALNSGSPPIDSVVSAASPIFSSYEANLEVVPDGLSHTISTSADESQQNPLPSGYGIHFSPSSDIYLRQQGTDGTVQAEEPNACATVACTEEIHLEAYPPGQPVPSGSSGHLSSAASGLDWDQVRYLLADGTDAEEKGGGIEGMDGIDGRGGWGRSGGGEREEKVGQLRPLLPVGNDVVAATPVASAVVPPPPSASPSPLSAVVAEDGPVFLPACPDGCDCAGCQLLHFHWLDRFSPAPCSGMGEGRGWDERKGDDAGRRGTCSAEVLLRRDETGAGAKGDAGARVGGGTTLSGGARGCGGAERGGAGTGGGAGAEEKAGAGTTQESLEPALGAAGAVSLWQPAAGPPPPTPVSWKGRLNSSPAPSFFSPSFSPKFSAPSFEASLAPLAADSFPPPPFTNVAGVASLSPPRKRPLLLSPPVAAAGSTVAKPFITSSAAHKHTLPGARRPADMSARLARLLEEIKSPGRAAAAAAAALPVNTARVGAVSRDLIRRPVIRQVAGRKRAGQHHSNDSGSENSKNAPLPGHVSYRDQTGNMGGSERFQPVQQCLTPAGVPVMWQDATGWSTQSSRSTAGASAASRKRRASSGGVMMGGRQGEGGAAGEAVWRGGDGAGGAHLAGSGAGAGAGAGAGSRAGGGAADAADGAGAGAGAGAGFLPGGRLDGAILGQMGGMGGTGQMGGIGGMGLDASSLERMGVSPGMLAGMGVNADMLRGMGLDMGMLASIGVDAAMLHNLGFTSESLQQLGLGGEASGCAGGGGSGDGGMDGAVAGAAGAADAATMRAGCSADASGGAGGNGEWRREEGSEEEVEERGGEGVEELSMAVVLQRLEELAEATAARDESLPRRLLPHLRPLVNERGNAAQRVAAHFTQALAARQSGSGAEQYNRGLNASTQEIAASMERCFASLPYLDFCHVAAMRPVLAAVNGSRRIHIIVFGFWMGRYWLELLQALAAFPGGPPSLRVTGIDITCRNELTDSKSSAAFSGRLLSRAAAALAIPFRFKAVEEVEVEEGEATVVQCNMSLLFLADDSVLRSNPRDTLLRWIRSLSPLTTVVVEMDAPLNSPFFLPRFRAALRVFSSIFASLDAALPRDSPHRHTCERLYFARDIVNVVACEGIQRTVRAESLEQWQARMRRAGFVGMEVGVEVMEELRGVLRKGGRKYGGYEVVQQGNGVRLLWEGVPVLAASMWL
ncbi:unnamed protein product [Closterium sp. Yama58-4]|nr:unnamed protein product [Closterium sp. Yama58-4]